jgi:hypothetical protein
MPTLFFRDFKGRITSAEATEQKDLFVVASGPHAGNWPKARANKGRGTAFFTSWAAAREAALKLLDNKIARLERGVAILKGKRAELEKAAGP